MRTIGTAIFRLVNIVLLLVNCGALNLRMSTTSSTTFVTNRMCPFAQKAWIALEASNIPYDLKEISLYGSNGKPDWFLKLNPLGTVPVLSCDHGATVIPDSELILDYIGSGVLGVGGGGGHNELELDPTDVKLVDSVKMWRKRISEMVIPVGKKAVIGGGRQDLLRLLKELNEFVDGPYLCGDILTLADCTAFPFLWRIDQEFGPLTEEKHGCGKFRNWLDFCEGSESFKRTIQGSWWWWW